jgi:T5SS/PEP-CTERM-associated repeat protein
MTASGDVDPADPADWGDSTRAYVGKTAEGSVTVDDDSDMVSREGYLGDQSGSTGLVTVSGTGSTWTNSSLLTVGGRGSGRLDISNGGAVSNTLCYVGYDSDSTGAVTVSGAGSTWTNSDHLRVGGGGAGTLDITNGAAVSSTSAIIDSSSTGAVTVSGVGSTWTNSSGLFVGDGGNGTLNITNGATVSSSHAAISFGLFDDTAGSVTVSGAGSTWTNTGHLLVGIHGNGSLEITNGAAVSNAGGYIGQWGDSTGSVTVSGAGSIWTNSGDLYVGGPLGAGTLEVTNGAAVRNSGSHIGGSMPDSTGVVTVSGTGSTWTNSGNVHVGHHGTGSLLIDDGGLISVGGTLTIDDDRGRGRLRQHGWRGHAGVEGQCGRIAGGVSGVDLRNR